MKLPHAMPKIKNRTRQIELQLLEFMVLVEALTEYDKDYRETLNWAYGKQNDEVTEVNKKLIDKLQAQVNDLIKVKSWKKSQVKRRHLIKRADLLLTQKAVIL